MRLALRSFLLASTLAVGCVSFSTVTVAQGIPVFDASAIAKHVEQIQQLTQQLDTMKQQLEQAQQLYGSFNKITDIGNLGSVLNNPEVRNALPEEFSQVESLLKGNGDGIFSGLSNHFQGENSTYESSANSFYAQELARNNKQNAGAQSLGQAMYDAASKRMAGLETLKQRLSTATDAKEAMDLQARFAAESAFVQTDLARMSGLKMVIDAQAQVAQQRAAENNQKAIDNFGQALQ